MCIAEFYLAFVFFPKNFFTQKNGLQKIVNEYLLAVFVDPFFMYKKKFMQLT